MITLEEIRKMREPILACAKQHGAIRVRLFGSVSRGEARAGSDVDFLVQYEPERSLVDHISLIQELASLLKVDVDVVSERALSARLREQVLLDAVDL
jgi:predicted nucleotidyltransferase